MERNTLVRSLTNARLLDFSAEPNLRVSEQALCDRRLGTVIVAGCDQLLNLVDASVKFRKYVLRITVAT
jgi:hypothetical protein